MQNDILASLSRLSDADLVARVKSLVARERDATAQLVAHLAELDTRDVHLREGYGSLFVYCRDAPGLSEWEAYNRIEVARAARRFPSILDMLAEGSARLSPRLDVPPSVRRLSTSRPDSPAQAAPEPFSPAPTAGPTAASVAPAGEASVDGIQLRCRRHDDYEGRLSFGKRRPARELVLEQVRLSVTHSTS